MFAKISQNSVTAVRFGEVLLFFFLMLVLEAPHLLLLIIFSSLFDSDCQISEICTRRTTGMQAGWVCLCL